MIKREDIIGYKKENSFKGVVLENILEFSRDRIGFELVKLPNSKTNKIAVGSSIDFEAENVMKILIEKNVSELKKYLPIQGKEIKPLYLFLDEEVLLYAKLRNLKFKQKKEKEDKIQKFTNEFEKKHPELKRAIVNTILELYK